MGAETNKKLDSIIQKLVDHYSNSVSIISDDPLDKVIFYFLSYHAGIMNTHRALKVFKDEAYFSDWHEVRVATIREIDVVLKENNIPESHQTAANLKVFLQEIFEEFDSTDLSDLKRLKPKKIKEFVTSLTLPMWTKIYLLAAAGINRQIPWDDKGAGHGTRVLGRIANLPNVTNPQKNLLFEQAIKDRDSVLLLNILVEHGKKTCQENPLCKKCPIIKECKFYKNIKEQEKLSNV